MGKIWCAMLGLALAASLSVETIGISSRQPRSYEIDFVAEKPDAEVLAAQMSKRRDPEVGVTNLSVWEEGDGPVPFQLMLAALDRPGYAIGERFIFDVVLKHVGSKPFAFPWSRDHRGIRRSDPNARTASIMLSFKDSGTRNTVVGRRKYDVRCPEHSQQSSHVGARGHVTHSSNRGVVSRRRDASAAS